VRNVQGDPGSTGLELVLVEPGLWIARAPVSRRAWRAFARACGRAEPPRSWWPWSDDAPARGVTWGEARAFCRWAGLALPTQAEWERAAARREVERPQVVLPGGVGGGAVAFPHAASTACEDGAPRAVDGGAADVGLRPVLRGSGA
jgi:hypothetical protein